MYQGGNKEFQQRDCNRFSLAENASKSRARENPHDAHHTWEKSMMALPSSLALEEQRAPIDPQQPPNRQSPSLAAALPIVRLLEQAEDDSSTCSLSEEEEGDAPPRYRETSESESRSSTSSESEYSQERDRESAGVECAAESNLSQPEMGTASSTSRALSFSLETQPGTGTAAPLQQNVSGRNTSLGDALVSSGVVSASPQSDPWTKQGTRVTGQTPDPGEKRSPHRLSAGSSSNLSCDPQLTSHAEPSGSSSNHHHTGAQDESAKQDNALRRSSRQSREPHRLSVGSFSPSTRRNNRKRKHFQESRVYGVETVADLDEWDAYGKMARRDIGKACLLTATEHTAPGSAAAAPAAASVAGTLDAVSPSRRESTTTVSLQSRVYDQEVGTSLGPPPFSPVRPLHEWAEDAQRQSSALDAKRQRVLDSIDYLSDLCAGYASRTSSARGRKQTTPSSSSTERMERTEDVRMLNSLEEDMQVDLVPAYVTSDCAVCLQVYEQCKPLEERLLCQYRDKENDAWSLKHFSLESPGLLSETEVELAWLAQESLYCLASPFWDWNFIVLHASEALRKVLVSSSSSFAKTQQQQQMSASTSMTWVRPEVSHEFRQRQELIRTALNGGYRRPHMTEVVSRHLEILREREEEYDE